TTGLKDIASHVSEAQKGCVLTLPEIIAPALKAGYQATIALRQRVAASQLPENGRVDLLAELREKEREFQHALALSLALAPQASTTRQSAAPAGPFGGGIEETSRSVSPG